MRASISPITGHGLRSKASPSPLSGPLTRPPVRSISQPQAAILGTYAVVKRPWVVQDELGEDVIAVRPIMNLTLTYDHRLVDGALAGRFLRDLRHKLETWDESAY